MTTREPWHIRWRKTRRLHFSSAEKLAGALNEAGYLKVNRYTVQRWEWPRPKGSRPTKYRTALSAMNDDFAVLMDELDEREREADDSSDLQDLTDSLGELAGTVSSLETAMEALERRVAALEHPHGHGASESA